MTVSRYLVDVEDWHIHYIAANMRDEDKNDVYLHAMVDPLQAIKLSSKVSAFKKTVMVDGEPIGIFGIGCISMVSGIGSPWFLSTPEIKNHAYRFIRESKRCIDNMKSQYTSLQNFVHPENKFTIKWLKWMGFDILDKVPYGPLNEEFHVFKMETEK